MTDVKRLVRDLLNDTTVHPKKKWDGRVEAAPANKPDVTKQSGTIRVDSGPFKGRTYERNSQGRLVRVEPASAHAVEVLAVDALDANCEHQWQWKSGVKTCWLCGGPAPLDRRDETTRWKG